MNDRIDSALESLWGKSRFVSFFYQNVSFIPDANIPTLALAIHSARLILYYNEKFISGLGEDGLICLLVHEMMHGVLNHSHRAYGGSDLYLQNLAQDMVINSFMAERSGTFFSRPGERDGARLVVHRGLPVVPEDFRRETGIDDPSWEDVYGWLKSKPQKTVRRLSGRSGRSGFDIPLDAAAPGSLDDLAAAGPLTGKNEDLMDTIDFAGMKGLVFIDETDAPVGTGVHVLNDRETLDKMDAKRTQIMNMAETDREMREERAYQEIKGIIEKIRRSDISTWRHLLKSLVDFSSQSNEWVYTYGRFDRRYFAGGIYAPGRIFKEQEILTVAVDVSGSMVMNPADIESAFGVLEELLVKYRINLVCLDEDLFVPRVEGEFFGSARNLEKPYYYRKGDWKRIRTGSGGTTFFAPLFNSYMKGRAEMLLVITDGYIYDLEKLRKYHPTVWVIPSGRRDPFRPPFGRVIRIETGETDIR